MREFLAITKALGDKTRIRALLALRNGELCLCQMIEFLALSPATMSKHMGLLVQAGLVERRKEGRWCFFRLAGRQAPEEVRQALTWALNCLRDDPIVQDDARRVVRIRRFDPTKLSECYRS